MPRSKARSAPIFLSASARSVDTTNSGSAAPSDVYFGLSNAPNAPTVARMRRISGWKITTVERARYMSIHCTILDSTSKCSTKVKIADSAASRPTPSRACPKREPFALLSIAYIAR